ncbi:MAG: type II toxin-antitoxin system Phd/YefM family antitoxin [Candidatus Rokubacteria bacterium]|nr:type II toxin-antitoxin system Phd/YefM family antitoxin [Candidatus Rokubacteria bacterium]
MAATVNIHAAKLHFARLVERAAQGEEILIARAGKPIAKLGPLTRTSRPRRPGLLKGKIRMRRDFNAPLPEDWLRLFEGR